MVESMSTKVIKLFVSFAMGCILAAGTATAQVIQSPEAPDATGRLENAISTAGKYQSYVYGVVKEIGKNQIVLDKTRFGNDQVFKLERKTRFVDNGKPGKLAELKVGDMVWIDAKIKKKTDEKIARKVIKGVGPKSISD
jgi:hypothetical protein